MDKKLDKPSNKCPKFWHKSLLCFARILSIGVVSSFAFGNGEPSAGIQAEPKLEARRAFLPLDPKSALAFLKASGTVLGSPQIFVSRFNVDEGLLVGYQSETGKRILFRSRTFPGIGTSGQVLHFDSETNEISQFVGRSKSRDDKGKRLQDVSVGGVDIRRLLKRNKDLRSDSYNSELLRLKSFAAGEAGRALLDAVPAMYAVLDEIDPNPSANKLLDPFGSVVMMLQLLTETYPNQNTVRAALGEALANSLKQSCDRISGCEMLSARFMLHSQGLFDPLSKNQGAAGVGNVKKG